MSERYYDRGRCAVVLHLSSFCGQETPYCYVADDEKQRQQTQQQQTQYYILLEDSFILIDIALGLHHEQVHSSEGSFSCGCGCVRL
jgi:hypothetical protein